MIGCPLIIPQSEIRIPQFLIGARLRSRSALISSPQHSPVNETSVKHFCGISLDSTLPLAAF